MAKRKHRRAAMMAVEPQQDRSDAAARPAPSGFAPSPLRGLGHSASVAIAPQPPVVRYIRHIMADGHTRPEAHEIQKAEREILRRWKKLQPRRKKLKPMVLADDPRAPEIVRRVALMGRLAKKDAAALRRRLWEAENMGAIDYFRKRCETVNVPTDAAGIMATQAVVECCLDELRHDGILGDKKETLRRHEAGLWLRRCFERAGLRQGGAVDYEVKGARDAFLRATPEEQYDDEGKLTDAQSWNRKAYNEAMREIGGHSMLVEAVSCFDMRPRNSDQVHALRDGLDRLAKFRGIE